MWSGSIINASWNVRRTSVILYTKTWRCSFAASRRLQSARAKLILCRLLTASRCRSTVPRIRCRVSPPTAAASAAGPTTRSTPTWIGAPGRRLGARSAISSNKSSEPHFCDLRQPPPSRERRSRRRRRRSADLRPPALTPHRIPAELPRCLLHRTSALPPSAPTAEKLKRRGRSPRVTLPNITRPETCEGEGTKKLRPCCNSDFHWFPSGDLFCYAQSWTPKYHWNYFC